MKKMKKILGTLLALPLLLSGCQAQKADLDIEFDVIVPTAYINEEYDFSEVLLMEEGVKYNLEVYYYDYYNKVEKTLEVKNDYYFTPLELFDVTVVVNAQKGSAKLSKSKTVPVSQKIDPIDELLISAGYSGWGDSGIMKEAVIDEQYFKGENSHSALSVHFQGSNPYTWGTTFLSLNNFRLLPLWSDQTWENAVVHFWVYNPTDYPLEFQMRVCDNLTNLVDVDWGQALNNPQFAQPNEWAEINFSLKHMGVNHTLYQNEDGTRDDSVIVKVKYGGTPTSGLEVYSYQFYVDDVDVIPYSEERFPDLDTKCYASAETIEYGWENMARDDGWSRANVLFDRELTNSSAEHTSLSSMFLTFNGVTLGENDFHNGYSVILNPEVEFEAPDLPSFRHGTLDFDIQFSNDISDKSVKIICVQDGWEIFSRFNVTPVNGTNNWMHVSIDFGEYSDCYSINKGIRLGFGFPGITESNKATANVHIDNIIFHQNGGIPEADIPVATAETIEYGWENMVRDDGWTRANVLFDRDLVNSTAEHTSLSSMLLTFDGVTLGENDFNNGYSVILCPEVQFGNDGVPSFRHGTLDFDVQFSNNITDKNVKIICVQNGWEIFSRFDVTPVNGANNWMHVSIDFGEHSDCYNIDKGIRLGFGFPGITEDNKDTANVHLDNIIFNQNGGIPEENIH